MAVMFMSKETPVIAPDSSKEVGTLTVASGSLVVSDPGYDTKGKNRQLQGVMKAKNGIWRVALHEAFDEVLYGNGPVLLEARHESELGQRGMLRCQPKSIGVDTGMVGIFDGGAFESEHPTTQDEWRHPESTAFDNFPQPCVLPYGIITSTNGGDGLYRYYVRRDADGLAVAVICSLVSVAMVAMEGEVY